MNLDLKKTGSFIQSCRKELGLTQAELGERLCVSPQSVSNWERGETLPDLEILLDLASIFDCSIDAIVSGGHCAGKYRRRITVAQMREAIGCIHRMHDLMGPDHFIYRTMVSALNERMNSEIEPAFSDPFIMDAYICEALIACARDCGDWVDVHDVEVNIMPGKPRDYTIRRLKELGMK